MLTPKDLERMDAEAGLKAASEYLVRSTGFLLSELPKVHREALWRALCEYDPVRILTARMAEHIATLTIQRVRAKRASARTAKPALRRPKAVRR